MKTLLSAVLLTTTLFGFAVTTAKQNNFTLKPDRDTISINVGETATFAITITALNGFDASIFLAQNPGSPQMLSSTSALTNSIVNAPYTGVKFTVTTSKIFTKGGVYSFHITGTNDESFPSTATCYVRVIPDTRAQWRFLQQNESFVYVPNFVFQDADNNYWHNYKGMQKETKDTPMELWGNNPSSKFVHTELNPIVNVKNNRVWMSYNGSGIVSYTLEGNSKTLYYTSNSALPDNDVLALGLDSTTGAIWAATRKGLARFEGTEWTVFNSTNTNSILDNELISSIVIAGTKMWIGTAKGIVRYDGKEWKRFTPQNSGMPAPFARVFAVEANGDVWMGLSNDPTDDGIGENRRMIGIAKFDGTNWTLFDNKTAPLGKSNYVNSIAIDSKGNKWISTIGHLYPYGGTGILKYDNTSWTSYNTENSPLPSNEVNWVGVDNEDNVWFHQRIDAHSSGVKNFWGVFNENGLPPFLAPPTGVEEQPEVTDGIAIYPNPTSTTFTINGADNILSVKLMNSLGMEVSRKSVVVSGSVEVDVEDLASGVYFVQVRTATGVIIKSIVVL